jgi:hypothetical protein
MAEPTDTNPGDPANPPTEPNAPTTDTSQPAAHAENPFEGETTAPPNPDQHSAPVNEPQVEVAQLDTTADQQTDLSNVKEEAGQAMDVPNVTPSIESSLPPMDTTGLEGTDSFDDTGLPSFDSALPSVGSSAAPDLSLPAIDTTLPSLDSSLPAIGTDIPTMDEHHTFDDSHFDDHDHDHTVEHSTHHDHMGQQSGSANGSNHYQTQSNGTYQYTQSPGPQQQYDGHQQSQAQAQHQFQSQPPQNYQQQQSSDMYHNQGGFSSVNANPGNNGQGQHGQVPQAPIGSPMPSNMPPMSSMGQYMTGYPSNVSQPGMNSNQMGYPMPGDPNKILSGGRHKKEVKRRTKTGCLTCRKRRIKVCDALSFCTLRAVRGAEVSLVPADPAIVYFISRSTHDSPPFCAGILLGHQLIFHSATKVIQCAEIA